jgi:IgA Peptidase M64
MSWLAASCSPQSAPVSTSAGNPVAAHGALRLELRHQVAAGNESFALSRMTAEQFSLNPRRCSALPDWGDYRLSAYDADTQALVHRSGFDSPLDAHASSIARLSVRLPVTSKSVRAVIEKRRAADTFVEVWSSAIDPAHSDIDRAMASLQTHVHPLRVNGDPQRRVNINILGDGYQASEEAKFVGDAGRAVDYLFSVEPYRARVQAFNVHAVFTASADSGVSDRYLGVERNTVFGCTYYDGTSERTLAPRNEHALRVAASTVAYDFVLVLANTRRYGGSACFGGSATVAIDSAAARYLVLHEFAHVIGGLADEYYLPSASGPAYAGNIEPWHPNVTLAAKHAKWAVPDEGATHWNQATYDRHFAEYVRRYAALRNAHADERSIEQLMKTEALRQTELLAKNKSLRTVGLFEGAHGYAKGIYRSEVDCIMFSLQSDYFCTACSQAIGRMISAHCA